MDSIAIAEQILTSRYGYATPDLTGIVAEAVRVGYDTALVEAWEKSEGVYSRALVETGEKSEEAAR